MSQPARSRKASPSGKAVVTLAVIDQRLAAATDAIAALAIQTSKATEQISSLTTVVQVLQATVANLAERARNTEGEIDDLDRARYDLLREKETAHARMEQDIATVSHRLTSLEATMRQYAELTPAVAALTVQLKDLTDDVREVKKGQENSQARGFTLGNNAVLWALMGVALLISLISMLGIHLSVGH